MTWTHFSGIASAAIALGIASSAQAAPIASSTSSLRAAAGKISGVDQTASRCGQRSRQGHCARYGGPQARGNRNRNGDYYEYDANKLPYGSQRWWDQMLRENRGGNPGGSGGRG
jgi:hypothetical protein